MLNNTWDLKKTYKPDSLRYHQREEISNNRNQEFLYPKYIHFLYVKKLYNRISFP